MTIKDWGFFSNLFLYIDLTEYALIKKDNRMRDVTLVLQDGTEFKGKSFGYENRKVLPTPAMQVS